MPIVSCPECRQTFKIARSATEESVRCPDCRHRFVLSADNDELPRKKKRKRVESRSGGRKVGLMVGIGAGIAVLLFAVAGWFLLGGGGGSGGELAREPKANPVTGTLSTVFPHQFPPAEGWKVAVEAADPPPANLAPAVALPDPETRPILAVAFADPSVATAAVVLAARDSGVVPWWQVSLAAPGGLKVVQLNDDPNLPGAPGEVALSPQGNKLATMSGGAQAGVTIWGADARKLSKWAEPGASGLWFASPDRLLVLAGDTLRCREVGTGKQLWERPLKLAGDAVLTPRRTWLLASVPGGIEAIATADGLSAGKLSIPHPHPAGFTRLSIHPSGTKLAATSITDGGVALATWNLNDGTSTFARYLSVKDKWQLGRPDMPPRTGAPPLNWVGDQQLLLNPQLVHTQEVYDLELAGTVWALADRYSHPATNGQVGPAGRLWRVTRPHAAQEAAFTTTVPGKSGLYLTATTFPPLPTDGIVVGVGTSYRVKVEGVSWHQGEVAAALADALAARGLRVAPDAEVVVHFTGLGTKHISVPAGERVNPKWNEPLPPGYELRKVIDGYEANFKVELRDKQGRTLRGGEQNLMASALDPLGKGRVTGWKRAAELAAGTPPPDPMHCRPGSAPLQLPQQVVGTPTGTVLPTNP